MWNQRFYGCGGRTWTYDLRVMSPTSCQLLYAAILIGPHPDGAGDRARTGTVSLPRDFKSLVSTNSTTPANIGRNYNTTFPYGCQWFFSSWVSAENSPQANKGKKRRKQKNLRKKGEEIRSKLWYNWITTKQQTKQKGANPSMSYSTTDTYKMKQEILNYSKKFSGRLSAPEAKFNADMLWGSRKNRRRIICVLFGVWHPVSLWSTLTTAM